MKKFLSVVLVGAMMLSLTSCGKKDSEEQTEPTAAPTNVTVHTAGIDTIMTTCSNTGEVVPAEEVSVSAKVSGKAMSCNIEVGKYVNAGDVLFTIEDTDYKLQLNQAKAALSSAEAGYQSTVGGTQKQSVQQVEQALTAAQLQYDSAKSAYEREQQLNANNSNYVLAETAYNDAKAAYERAQQLYDNNSNVIVARNAYNDAKAAYDRTKSLFDLGAATQVALDSAHSAMVQAEENLKTVEMNARTPLDSAHSAMVQAEENLKTVGVNSNTALEAAETAYKNAKEALETAQKNYDLTINVLNPERQQTAASSVQSAKAAYELAANTVANTVVKAPISGYVTTNNVVVGQMVQAGSPMVSIIDTNSMDIKLKVTEATVSNIVPGSEAKISVKSANIENIDGTVATVSPSKDAQTGLFEVVINVPNGDSVLKGGMFADVTIVTTKYEGLLCIPLRAILTEDDKSYVYVESNGMAEKREVVLGHEDENNTEVVEGVAQGDNVIVKGKEYITESNKAVKIVED